MKFTPKRGCAVFFQPTNCLINCITVGCGVSARTEAFITERVGIKPNMFLSLQVGNLTEPLTGRTWDRQKIGQQLYQRIAHYQSCGMSQSDRVFLHYGNQIEFFVDILAIWSLGGCVIPIDARLTAFEVETLARAATPRFSLWYGAVDSSIAASLSSLDVKILETSSSFTEGTVVSIATAMSS